MKSSKNIIFSIFLAGLVFITPLKTNALTIEEIMKNASSLLPININEIKDTVNYDYHKDIEEISSILDESLNNSKNANDELVELNTLMNSINEDNKALLNIKDKQEYDESVAALKEKVETAKEINTNAKTSSQNGLDKYNEALAKYASLKVELEEKKEKAEAILNTNISTVNTKLDIINNLLDELNKTENKLKEAYNEANIAYENAKENAEVANNNFSEKLEELKEYVEVNGEQELKDLIQVNTNYLASGVLYATSQVALKLIDIEINLVEKEIASLEADLALLDEQLAPYEEALTNKENELATLKGELNSLKENLNTNGTVAEINAQITSAQAVLQNLKDSKEDKESAINKCSNYIGELNTAIADNDTAKVVELLLKNEESYGFTEKNITVTTETKFNSSFELVNYIFVTDTDTSEEYVYSYEENDGVVTIYEQNKVAEHEVTELTGSLTSGKYLAYLNGTSYNVTTVDIPVLGKLTGFNVGSKIYYNLRYDNGWKATITTDECENYTNLGFTKICTSYKKQDVNVTVTEAEHYEQGNGNPITSQAAVDRCNALETNTIDAQISLQEAKITELQEKLTTATTLENQIAAKNAEIAAKENEVTAAETELNNQKATITSEAGMTYAEIEAKLDELNEKLNHYPKLGDERFTDDLASIGEITSLIANAAQGNVDVQAIVETINNLNVGLNIKKDLISQIDKILANSYNKAKQDLIDVAGEDLENISNLLKEIAPLISDVAESNLKLLEEKTKYELAKASYEALLNAKELVVNAKEDALNELEDLEQLKEENNLDLSDLDNKFKEAEESLVNVENEVEVKINDYVEVEDENTETEEPENNTDTDTDTDTETETDTTIKEENKPNKNNANKNNQNSSANKDEEKVENNTTTEKEDTEDTNGEVFDPEEEFNWLNLLWLLPIALIIFFIIFFIKRKKDKKEK